MNKKVCIVFIDAFSYKAFNIAEGIKFKHTTHKLVPGVGYSSNLHHQIFSGNTPDEVNFFTDYAFIENHKKIRTNRFSNFLDEFGSISDVYRFFLQRFKLQKKNNIPYSEKNAFKETSLYKFKHAVTSNICDIAFKCINEVELSANFKKAEELLKSGDDNVILIIEEMDKLGHIFGPDSNEYLNYGNEVVKQVNDFYEKFSELSNDGVFILLSDHGMFPVDVGVDVLDSLYSKYGLPGKDYFVYNDSVYLRLWIKDEVIKNNICDFLSNMDFLHYIDSEARIKYGITKTDFGDLIFCLKEGYMFKPNCFDIMLKSLPKGMHGYIDESDGASGIFVINKQLNINNQVSASNVYSILVKYLNNHTQ